MSDEEKTPGDYLDWGPWPSGEPMRVEDLLDGLPRLSTEDEVRELVDGKLVKMREIK